MTSILDALRRALGERVVTDAEVLDAHRRDAWMLSELRDFEGRPGPRPLAVVEATTTAEVSTVLSLCRESGFPVVPYGGGSGVCGAIAVGENSVVLSTRRLDGLVEIDDTNLLATFRSGTNGMDAERRVQQAGLTIGHWPQSIELSTVGGWVATRAAGQFSTGYGNVEDMLLDLEAVLPDGSVVRTRRTPRASAGPDLRQIFLGSEGTLGVITEVTFSLRPLPETRRGQAFHFGDFAAGLEPVRRLMRAGWRPPVVRLYDALESPRHFGDWCPEGRAMLILLHEGPEALVDAESLAVARLCSDAGGVASGAAPVDHWLEKRNDVPGFRVLLENGLIVDTIEVACTWDKVVPLYRRVTESLREVAGMRLASSHSSHSYRSGTNLYFTFVAMPDDASALEATYRECWQRTMEAADAVGAGLSHHHGIGRVRRGVLEREIGPGGVALLRRLKHALDPDGLLNPGALLPPEDDGPT